MAKQLTIEAELRRYGVRLDYARFRPGDTNEGRLLKNTLVSFAEYEREKIAFRTARGRRTKARSGTVVGSGPAPYGFRYTYTADGKVNGLALCPETVPVARRIVRELAHRSAGEVAAEMKDGTSMWCAASACNEKSVSLDLCRPEGLTRLPPVLLRDMRSGVEYLVGQMPNPV